MSVEKSLPFSNGQIEELASQFETPFHLYDEAGMRRTAERLAYTFGWVAPIDGQDYINYFAVKATPNPYIMEVLADEGMGADASSGPEVELSKAVGLETPFIMFTSNNTAPEEYREAHAAGAIINLDDINQIDVLCQALDGSFPETISFRYNPGNNKKGGVNSIIGTPEDAKFGVPDWQLASAYRRAKELGAERFGIHTMVVSNELDTQQHIATARMLFSKVADLSRELGIEFEFANLGGGLGIPYEPGQEPIDYKVLREGIRAAYDELITGNGLQPLRVVTENGRHVTGPHGFLVTRVRSVKDTYHRYVGLDASMADLMRPGMYDAYHHITVLGKSVGERLVQRVVGSLCENNDNFTGKETMGRELPVMEPGDLVVIHDTGAHGRAMGFNYNGKLQGAELLVRSNGVTQQIRARQKREELFKGIQYPGLPA